MSSVLQRARPRLRPRWAVGLLAAAMALGAAAFLVLRTGGPAAHFVEYPVGATATMPIAIAAGPDGSVWFTIDLADAVG
ncbi:MAG: hypothetical protein J0I21_21080, partial [Alphaproteobacteria bacterium]|nr:hypothetical protein [Alphaproteobacteria bacterium]